jgi:tetratricopeptide (TPR) repeat protein
MEHALERAMTHAERAGDQQMQSRILGYLARVTVTGPQPVEQCMTRCQAILERAGDDIVLRAVAQTMLAVLEAMSGKFDQARERRKASEQQLLDVGLSVTAAALQMYSAFIELLAETPEKAEPGVREAYALLERIGEGHRRAMMAAVLARLLCAQGRDEESEQYTQISEETASEDDIGTQVIWRGTRARVRARAGHSQLAEQLADNAVELAGDTDYLMLRGDALSDRAEVLAESGRLKAAERNLEQAITLYEQKGIGPSADAARRRCQSLSVARMG